MWWYTSISYRGNLWNIYFTATKNILVYHGDIKLSALLLDLQIFRNKFWIQNVHHTAANAVVDHKFEEIYNHNVDTSEDITNHDYDPKLS